MSLWSGGTGIAKFASAAPFMTGQLTAIQGAVKAYVVSPAKVVRLARRFILLNKPSCGGLGEGPASWPQLTLLEVGNFIK